MQLFAQITKHRGGQGGLDAVAASDRITTSLKNEKCFSQKLSALRCSAKSPCFQPVQLPLDISSWGCSWGAAAGPYVLQMQREAAGTYSSHEAHHKNIYILIAQPIVGLQLYP